MFSQVLEIGKIYSFSDIEIKLANKYNRSNNKFEVFCNEMSKIKLMKEDNRIIKKKCDFVKLN